MTLTSTWVDALEGYCEARTMRGIAASTITRERRALLAVARAVPVGPWQTSGAHVAAWLERDGLSDERRRQSRLTLRAFYRWGIEAGHVAASPVPAAAEVSGYAQDARWADALAAFEVHAERRGLSPAYIGRVRKHVERFAREVAVHPWEARSESIAAWLDTLGTVQRTRDVHRSSLRSFYRWAAKAGYVHADPTDPLANHLLALGAPSAWAVQLEPWRAAGRAAGLSEATLMLRQAHVERFARAHASLDPWAVTLDDVLSWAGRRRWALETRRGFRGSMRAFYAWAVDTGRVEASPVETMPRVRSGAPVPRPALEHEYRAALDGAEPRFALALRLAAELGMRCAEVAQAHSRDLLDTEDGIVLVVHGKGAKVRHLPVPADLARDIRARGVGYLLPGNARGHLSSAYVGKRISMLLPLGVSMHALRHRFATRVYAHSRDLLGVQQLLGHASPATTQRYVKVTAHTLRGLVEAAA